MPIATIQLPDGRIVDVEVPEGATPEAIESFVMSQPEFQAQEKPSFLERFGRLGIPEGGTGILPSKETLSKVGEAALEIGPGLGELGAGAVQLGAEVLGAEKFAGRIGQQVAREREQLTGPQKVGRVAGQIIGTAPIAASGIAGTGAAALIPSTIQSAGTIAALTPTEEGTAEAKVKQIGTGVKTGLATAGIIKGAGGAAAKAKQLGQEAIKRVKSGIGARNVEALENATATLKQKSSDLYDRLRKLNSDINPEAGAKLVTKLDKTLIQSGKLNKRLHGDTMSVVDDIRADAKAGEISLEGLDQHRQNLSAVIKKDTDTITGTVGSDGQKATMMIDKLDDLVERLDPSDLGVGKAVAVSDDLKPLAAQAKQFDNVDDFVERVLRGDASGIRKGKDGSTLFREAGNKKISKLGLDKQLTKAQKEFDDFVADYNKRGAEADDFIKFREEEAAKGINEKFVLLRNKVDVAKNKMDNVKTDLDFLKDTRTNRQTLAEFFNKVKTQPSSTQALEARSLLKEAKKDWKVYKKFQRIANLAERADGDPNRIKAIFQQFVAKKKNLRGFTPDEIKALKFTAANSTGEKLLKTFGKFGFDFGASATQGNTFLPVASLATGATGSPVGPALTAVGTAARQAQKLVARGKVEDALSLIQQGGVDAAEVISKMPSQKARQELLTRLLSIGAAQQNIGE